MRLRVVHVLQIISAVLLLSLLAACSPGDTVEAQALPTRVELPTLTPTASTAQAVLMRGRNTSPTEDTQPEPTSTATNRRPTLPPSWTPTFTPTITPTRTLTVTPSLTSTPTRTPTPTITPQGRSPMGNRVQEIYARGQALGNQADVFSTVGDCITALHPFLIAFDQETYELGEFDHLQDTVDAYSGWFGHSSLAAGNNYTSATVLDPMWAFDRRCESGESPLACEYRLTKPSVVVIMLGTNDVARYNVDSYRLWMEEILDFTIEQGIIPVLTTFPTLPNYYNSQSEAFNEVIVDLANDYEIPLIDWRNAASELPNNGMEWDGLHPTNRGNDFIDFSGEQDLYGITLRNLLTLQMLDSIRVSISAD